jgi:MarR family transcriptional regulator, organic hydroperoxide resistance regulator
VHDDRPDLGMLFHRLRDVVIRGELPLFAAEGLEMWDYVVLSGLAETSAPTQARLADAVGRDRTRLITTLDNLEDLGLVTRQVDPDDRRNRIVSLTPSGRAKLTRCRKQIRRMEATLLEALPENRRQGLISDLMTLLAAESAVDDPDSVAT